MGAQRPETQAWQLIERRRRARAAAGWTSASRHDSSSEGGEEHARLLARRARASVWRTPAQLRRIRAPDGWTSASMGVEDDCAAAKDAGTRGGRQPAGQTTLFNAAPNDESRRITKLNEKKRINMINNRFS